MSLEWNESDNWKYVNKGATERIAERLSRTRAGLTASKLASFLSRIKIVPSGCWEWGGARYPTGYGMFNAGRFLDGRQDTRYVHRLAFELANGPIPAGLQIQHHCDRPECCFPDHLYAGTQSENMRDRTVRQRYPAEVPKRWKGWASPELRRALIAECLASPRSSGIVAKLAREHNINFKKLAMAVHRARQRQFLAATTGSMAAHR